MKLIINDQEVLYDKEDEPIVRSRKWHINSMGYAVWRGVIDGKKQTIRLHRLINKTPKGLFTDHINHNKLDNRRSNLRSCTQSENMRNKANQGKGYWYQRQNKNWVVEVWGKHIGCFQTEKEAQDISALVRGGGVYKKPIRTTCEKGHDITRDGSYYRYGKSTLCKICLKNNYRRYYDRKTKVKMERNNAQAV
jgi:hypothetical protein